MSNDLMSRRPRVRPAEGFARLATVLTLVAGVVSLVSAVLPADRSRLRVVQALLGSAPPRTATGTTVAVGVALVLLSGGLRRRQRAAWATAVFLTLGAGVLHVVKGLDVEEAAVCLAATAALWVSRRRFAAKVSRGARSRRLRVLAGLLAADLVVGLFVVRANDTTLASDASAGARLRHVLLGFAGVSGPLHFDADEAATVSAVLAGLGAITLLVGLGVLLVRAADAEVRGPAEEQALRHLLDKHGGQDSLAWFAGRDDRQLVVTPSGKAAVSYRVVGGVALAAGDPLGEPDAWPAAIEAFLARAAEAAWIPAVMGCGAKAAQTWARAGLDVLELGEEAVGEVAQFSLEGRAIRHVRQAVGRVERAGYRLSVRRCGELDQAEWDELRAAVVTWRQGAVERGFSMALGRLADGRDAGGVVATARDGAGALRAVLHFVPWGDDGLSLDVMRRDPAGDNGVNESLIVALLAAAPGLGVCRVSLNFAAFRPALERGGQLGAGPVARAMRSVLVFASRWWQIEQLSRFNAKFAPGWVPRYLCYPSPMDLPAVAVAALRAEAFLVLPSRRNPAAA